MTANDTCAEPLRATPAQQQAACGAPIVLPGVSATRFYWSSCRRDGLLQEISAGVSGPGHDGRLVGRVFNHPARAPFELDSGNLFNYTDCGVLLPLSGDFNATCACSMSGSTYCRCEDFGVTEPRAWPFWVSYFESFLTTKPVRTCTEDEWLATDNCALWREDCRVRCDDTALATNCVKEYVCVGHTALNGTWAWSVADSTPEHWRACSTTELAAVECTSNTTHCRYVCDDATHSLNARCTRGAPRCRATS